MFQFPEARHGQSWLRHVNDLPVLSLAGSPGERGEAAGVLAMRPAEAMMRYPEDLLRTFCAAWLHRPLLWLGERLVGRFPAEYRQEMEAMVSGGGVERRQLVLGNTLFDIKKILACAAILVEPGRSAVPGTLLGRNLDYPSLGYAHEYSLVTIHRGAGKRAFASVGFPGLVGVLSGMNDAGLALSVLEVYQAPLFTRRLDTGGLTYALSFRRLLEECATLDEAHRLLSKMRRTTIYNLAIADRHDVAVFETTPRRVHRRPADQGACLCTNHFRLPLLRPLFSFNLFRTYDRLQAMQRHVRRRNVLEVADVQEGLHAANQGNHTLQTMIFEPAALRLHLATGDLPASANPLRTLDLGPLLVA